MRAAVTGESPESIDAGASAFGFDAYAPAEIARRVDDAAVAKARLPATTLWMLGFLAGAYIALGSVFYTLVASDHTLGFAAGRVLGGVVFSLGLVLVVVAGAELFTGNNLIAMAWAEGRVTTRELLRNWLIAFCANAIGAFGIAILVTQTAYPSMNGGAVGATAVKIAAAKAALPFWQAFFAGVLCNVLVCAAVWLTLAGRTVVDKIVAMVFPVSAFVAAGFEHSVANMYFIPVGLLLRDAADAGALDWMGYVRNLVPVTLGNIAGGSGLVALVYYMIYRRPAATRAAARHEAVPPHAREA